MCLNGFWGSVCGEEWKYVDAEIVCHQLGYNERENSPYVYFSDIEPVITAVICPNFSFLSHTAALEL